MTAYENEKRNVVVNGAVLPIGVQAHHDGAPRIEVTGFGEPFDLTPEVALGLATLLQGAAYEARTLKATRRHLSGEEAAQIAKDKAAAKASC